MEEKNQRLIEAAKLSNSFIVYNSWVDAMDMLTDKQFRQVILALRNYYPSGCIMMSTGDPLVDTVAKLCQQGLDENLKRRASGSKGGRGNKHADTGKDDNAA